MIQPVSFKGVYRFNNLSVYESALLNNYLYDKKNEGKKFYASNKPIELFSDIDRNNRMSLESDGFGVCVLTGKEAEGKKKISKQWRMDTIKTVNPDVTYEKQIEIWESAIDKFLQDSKNLIENAEESYTLDVSYDSKNNMPKFVIIA